MPKRMPDAPCQVDGAELTFETLRNLVAPALRRFRETGTARGRDVVRAVSTTLHGANVGLEVEGGPGHGDAYRENVGLLIWTQLVLVTLATIVVDEGADPAVRDDARWALDEAKLSASDLGVRSARQSDHDPDRGAVEDEDRVHRVARELWPALLEACDLDPDDTAIASFPPPPW